MAHFVHVMDVFGGFFREHLEIKESEEIDTGEFVLFAREDLVLDNAGEVILHAVLEELVLLLLDFDQDLFACIGGADDIS
jgi:hypothetical protein